MNELLTLFQVAAPIAMAGVAWKSIKTLEEELKGQRRRTHRHSNMLAVIFQYLGIEPPPEDD